MSSCCSCLTRLCCCRRESQHAYIYLYSPNMTASSSSSSSHWCLVCILFGLSLAFIVILSAMFIYYLNSSTFISMSTMNIDSSTTGIAQKLKLPDFINLNIDPCEYFYNYVCDKLISKKSIDRIRNNDEDRSERKWTQIRYEFHDQIMSNSNNQSITIKNDQISSIFHLYQLCENQSPELLIDELERYFVDLREQEPYRSYLTLFNQSKITEKIPLPSLISFFPNPFFQIQRLSLNTSIIKRADRRPLPPISLLTLNSTILNRTAFDKLIQFDIDYSNLLFDEKLLSKSYEQEYHLDSLIVKRILTFSNYHQCLSSLKLNTSNGLIKLIQLLNHFLHSRLHNFNSKSIDKQIRILDKITDNHTLIEHLQRIQTDFKTIEQIILFNSSKNSCIINLLDYLLDKRIHSYELIILNNITYKGEYFLSDDWPYLMMIYDRLLKNTSIDILINFVYFDYYRRLIYPYYQPHIQHDEYLHLNHSKEFIGYTYQTNYPNLYCHINSCFDIFNCYHPSLFNRLVGHFNQTLIDEIKINVENLINRFRLLTEQSDHLFSNEKQRILNELNQIHIQIGHYSSLEFNLTLPKYSSYLEYVQFYSSIPYDQVERSYYIEPIYYSFNHTLYLPFGFLSFSQTSIEYSIIKLILKIIHSTIQSHPYHIECSLKSSDDEHYYLNNSKIYSNDENLVYLFSRSKFLLEHDIILDEYLWPFMSANSLMKRFLIDYTAMNFCRNDDGYDLYRNNTYFLDDIHLIFRCQQASSIKQSKCTIN